MRNFLESLSVSRKLLLAIVCSLPMFLLVWGFFFYSEGKLILEERKSSVRQTVEIAYSVIEYYDSLATSGVMTEEAAKAQAKQVINKLRYNKTDYFWMNDSNARVVLHPMKPDTNGKDMTNEKDSDGAFLYRDFVKVANESPNGGFTVYKRPRAGEKIPLEKHSFVKRFAKWDWIIGSGVYVDTIERTIYERITFFAMVIVPFTIVVFVFGLMITRSITRPIERAVGIAKTIASGDLSKNIDGINKSETGQLLQALAEMSQGLEKIVLQVRNGADSINTDTHGIASGNRDISARSEQQASALEETAASMEELTVTVQQNSERAKCANDMVSEASQIASKAGEFVTQVVDTMKSIDESSMKIVDIISVIDGIAFQTNILALNAAVEAARAGDHGRGFAVVATEVRALAQKSAEAAKEIKVLIHGSVKRVEDGIVLVDKAGVTMDEMVASVRRASEVMAEISRASAEQSAGIEQVNEALTHMDSVTQQNVTIMEQAASASESLAAEAEHLRDLVSVFRLKHA